MVVSSGVRTAMADVQYSFTTIDVPGALGGTQARGVNDSGQIVGPYTDSTGNHGFPRSFEALTLASARFLSLALYRS